MTNLQVIRRAAADTESTVLDIYTSTEAVIFLGTPHRGSSKAGIAEVVRKIVSVSGFDTTDKNIRALQVNSTELELIHELFMKLYEQKERQFKVLTFQEAKGVSGISYLKLNERVVEPFSSSITGTEPTQTINANHMSMCRFPSRDDEGYKQILGEILILVSDKERKLNPSSALTDVERKCVALLMQNTSSAAEYKSSLPHRVEGTCQWILSNSQYRDWNSQKETCLLWISGYPGTGKTILSTYILEYLTAGDLSPSLHTTICYFFCDEKISTQRDGMAILRSLIHQLLLYRRLLIKYVKSAYDFHGPQLEQNFNELWRIFVAIASDKRTGPVSVIIDAIDECEEATRERFLQHVSQLMSKSWPTGSSTPCIKFLVTSRPLLGRRCPGNLLQIDPSQNHVEQDLRLVIRMKVERIVQRTRCHPDVRTYLENALFSRADRTFLWVTLVLHLLERSFLASQKDFKRIIDEMPKSLSTTYQRFLQGISMEYQPLANRLLHFLVGSSRPLTLKEMRILIAIQDHHHTLAAVEEDAQPNIQDTIEGVLGPLVRIWDSRIYLVHQSLKEFLQILSTQSENPLSAIYGVDGHEANLLLAERCISYLLLKDFRCDLFSPDSGNSPTSLVEGSLEAAPIGQLWDPFDLGDDTFFKDPAVSEAETCLSIGSRYAFFDYSSRHWAQHFSFACLISPPKIQESAIMLADVSTHRGSNWFRFYWHHAEMTLPYPRNFVPITTASYFGHSTSVELLLRHESTMEPSIGAYGLCWAARMGHTGAVDLLLGAGVDPDTSTVDGQNALTAAVQFNRIDIVKRLLEDDGFIPERNEYRVNYAPLGGRTPLSIAAGNGHVEIVSQLLLHARIKPDMADFNQWTPLFWTVGGRHLDVLQLLVSDPCVSINHVDRSGRNVLSWAAAEGELELVRYLFSMKHLHVDEGDRAGRTPFSWAAGNGHLETTVYLRRSERINLSRKDKHGRNAISWACSGGHHRVVEYLIKHDRRAVDEEDVDGWTPLAWALFSQNPRTVKVLLESGSVNVNKKDHSGRSALSFAAGYGYLDIVQMLLNTEGIEVESRDNDGLTPLSHAARCPAIVKVLQTFSK
ncbi:ankyrin [Mollisia scopiformis]|uniref:Ankyrin n=1 Tax=Mollisia scopiformis TaxID=149040 RepID=A0A132BBX5_MOLSC|nr:ankyrin [Mollisia scopiformis]KUJ09878.1 ankyrin [Mollisia scopiformis]